MDGTTLNIADEKLNALREVLPEAFSEGKIDWEKLKATLGEDVNFANERYVLNWAGKSDAFKVLQTPSTKTLVPAKDESVNFDQTENDFYTVNNNELVLLLEKATQEIMETVITLKPKKVIALDKLFTGNDQLKTNTVLQMRDAGVEFKTI